MAIVTVNLVDTFDEWRVKTNSISTNGGDLTTLTTTNKSSLVNALNGIKTTGNSAPFTPCMVNDSKITTYCRRFNTRAWWRFRVERKRYYWYW